MTDAEDTKDLTWLDDVIKLRLAAIALEKHDRPTWARNLREIADKIEAESLKAEVKRDR